MISSPLGNGIRKFTRLTFMAFVPEFWSIRTVVQSETSSNPELVSAIESLCKHSGGTKKIQSLITFLREKLGNEVSFSDDGLIQYLTEHKERFRENVTPDMNADHVACWQKAISSRGLIHGAKLWH